MSHRLTSLDLILSAVSLDKRSIGTVTDPMYWRGSSGDSQQAALLYLSWHIVVLGLLTSSAL